jgi:GNAT superfamily N-acetyltransferase
MAIDPIIKVQKPDLKLLSSVLAKTFFDDPVSCYYFPIEENRETALKKFFYIHMAKLYFKFGNVFCNESKTGVAIWSPPGAKTDDLRSTISLLPMATILRGRTIKALKAVIYLEKKHPKSPPHYYLATLGVLPEEQGKGYGSQLLRPILELCDQQMIPAYLESSKEKNLPFYERHGFNVTDEVNLPKGPKVWLMWRDPQE